MPRPARVLAQTQGMNHAYPHPALGVHGLGSLRNRHRQLVEPPCDATACAAVILQPQPLLHGLLSFDTTVQRTPQVAIKLAGMADERAGLDDLHLSGLLIPQIAEHIGGCTQQGAGLLVLSLFDQLAHHQHEGLLHADVDILGQWHELEQLQQRVLLGRIKWSGRLEQCTKDAMQVIAGEQTQ